MAAAPAASLKRPWLSPSPATGLTGLVQNRYLTCFIDNFAGYFRVLDEVAIRQGLINLMTGKVDAAQLVGATSDGGALAKPKRRREGKTPGGGRRPQAAAAGVSTVEESAAAAAESQRTVNAINSSVFSAMSVGAMLLGQPPSHVDPYFAVAEASLDLCGVTATAENHATTAVVPNEDIAAAALLLAFAANISGREEYALRIRLARHCYDTRVRHGLPTPEPIRDSLGYRAMIDAMGAPPDKRDLRIPSPCRAERVAPAAGPPPPPPPELTRPRSDSGDSSSDSGGGRAFVACPEQGGGGGMVGSRAATSGGGGGEASAAPPALRGRTENRGGGSGRRGGRPTACPPGLEAARERRRLRKAEPMSMVSDIMAMLSRVSWTARVEEAAQRTKRELSELRSLITAEKALVEERRRVNWPDVSVVLPNLHNIVEGGQLVGRLFAQFDSERPDKKKVCIYIRYPNLVWAAAGAYRLRKSLAERRASAHRSFSGRKPPSVLSLLYRESFIIRAPVFRSLPLYLNTPPPGLLHPRPPLQTHSC